MNSILKTARNQCSVPTITVACLSGHREWSDNSFHKVPELSISRRMHNQSPFTSRFALVVTRSETTISCSRDSNSGLVRLNVTVTCRLNYSSGDRPRYQFGWSVTLEALADRLEVGCELSVGFLAFAEPVNGLRLVSGAPQDHDGALADRNEGVARRVDG